MPRARIASTVFFVISKTLVAPDNRLNFSIEILHPDRGAGHPGFGKGIQPGTVNFIRVNLYREFAALGQGRDVKYQPGNAAHFIWWQHRGRPAAPSADVTESPPRAARGATSPVLP